MRTNKITMLSALLACLLAASAQAEETPPSPFTGYVAFMSNYVGRGLAQSVGEPSVQGELDYYDPSGWYVNLDGTSINWLDQLYPGDSVSLEVDGLLAYQQSFAQDWFWRLGVLRLQFPGRYVTQTPPVDRPDTTELYGVIGWKKLLAKLYYSATDSFGTPDSKGSWYLDLSGTQPLNERWSVGAHIGRRNATGTDPASGIPNGDLFSYTDYKVSAAYAFGGGLSVTLAHTWTNTKPTVYTLNNYYVGGHHWAVTLEKDF